MLGHTTEADFTDIEGTPKSLREVEAEAVALLCCEALNLAGADYCRGYIQNWLCPAIGYNGDAIPEKSAQKVFHAADQILKAGRLAQETTANSKGAEMRVIKLKCECDQPCFDQRVHEVAVEGDNEANWYGKPTSNPNCRLYSGPSSLGKKLKTKRVRKA
jgi:hypothetical protein